MSCLSVELYVYHRQYTKVLQLVLIHCGTMSSEKRVPNVPKEISTGLSSKRCLPDPLNTEAKSVLVRSLLYHR